MTQDRASKFAGGRPRIGLAEVRASFRAPAPEPMSLAYFARPLANLMTPAFYNWGLSADQVIVIRLAIGLCALLLLALGNFWTSVAGLAAYSLAYVLDCVDGNLSRLNDEGNYWGKFIDGFADDIVLFTAPFAIGIGLWAAGGGGGGAALVIGGIVSIVALLTGMARHRFSFVREWMVARTGPFSDEDTARIAHFERIRNRPVRLAMNLYCFAPWLVLLPEGGWVYLSVMLAGGTSANLLWLATTVGQASAVLRRPRQAAHAGEPVSKGGYDRAGPHSGSEERDA